MQHKSLVISLVAAGTILPSILPSISDAQSMPAGQVSHRMANKAVSSDATVDTNAAILQAKTNMTASKVAGAAATLSSGNAASDISSQQSALGAASQAAWNKVVAMDSDYPADSPNSMTAARAVAAAIKDNMGLSDAKKAAMAAKAAADEIYGTNPADKVQDVTAQIVAALDSLRCSYNTGSSAATKNDPQYQYQYRTWFPLIGPGCTNVAILGFFSANKAAETANNVKYLYNAQQSASQVTGDLVSATFAPGIQAVFAGTATAGPGESSSSTTSVTSGGTAGSTSSGSATPTDSIATSVAKIETGGDFNVRFPAPILYHSGGHYRVTGFTSPNVGFNINGFSGQNTITQATEYSFNVPLEFYAQTQSIDPTSDGIASAVLFLDLKPAAEVISSDLAQKIGLTGSRGFFLGQAAVGIEFSQSFRISFQYVYGPRQVYQTNTSTGSPTTTSSRIGGFHLAVSFSPQKSKTSAK